MTTICSGNKCEYADYCEVERIDGTTLKQAMDGVREYERSAFADYPYCQRVAKLHYDSVGKRVLVGNTVSQKF